MRVKNATLHLGLRTQLFYILLIVIFPFFGLAQKTQELGTVKVEELTEDQIRDFISESNKLNIQDDQIEEYALQQGMNSTEVVKLKERIKLLDRNKPNNDTKYLQREKPLTGNRLQDSISFLEQKPVLDLNNAFSSLIAENYGKGVFSNSKITFEPNLRIPTPKNYQLAADDELIIDVTGYSEANYTLKISPEGVIRIPLVGPIALSGYTIEQAKKIITQKLASTIYNDIKNGKTFVDVNLGVIRSIKITIIGEATLPGTYTLPSLASAYNALYACGGPNINGSYRNIQLIRNNITVAKIDVYDYLLKGEKKNNIRLMDQDVIKINTYNIRVELKGEVKKPGLYDVEKGETLATIIKFAGGVTDNAYTAKIKVFRNTATDRELSTINAADVSKIFPQKGDSYTFGKILNRFANRVSIKGAVYRPGEFELKDSLTLTRLILEADGLREDAFVGRASIHRLKSDLSPEIVSVELAKLLNGDIPDITLKKEDRVVIYSKFELKEGYYITVGGEIANPGVVLYEEGMTIYDVIMMGGGLKENASVQHLEVSRRIKNADAKAANPQTAIIFEQDINANYSSDSLISKITLLPFDEIYIRPAPGYFTQKNVVIEGEVIYAGKYTLASKNDRISDLVKRAGGLTQQAYLDGAVLVRSRQFTKTELANSQAGLNNLMKQNLQAGVPSIILQNDINGAFKKKSDNVGINLAKILKEPNTLIDLYLNDGDTLRIPKQIQTVRVNGEVLYPALVRYDKNYGFRRYIIASGGFGDRASTKKPYVIYANGAVKGTKSFLFFRNYPQIIPGAEIFVPAKKENERLKPIQLISAFSALASTMAIIFTLLQR
ncbi:MAG: capsule biosynthesis protein [Sphingobacteriales bacterium]|nr:MAG: capsule biosynthesis protein [Sphingobacteriales bacterium]